MKKNREKIKTLFIDSGKGYGGTASFLFYMLGCIDMRKFEPSVAFYYFNNMSYTRKIADLGIPVFFLNSYPEPADYVPFKWLLKNSGPWLLQKIKVILRLLLRMITVEIPLIRKTRELIKRGGVELVILNNDVHYHLAGTVAAHISGIPCICRKAGGINEGGLIKKILTPYVDLFIAVSRATTEDQVKNSPATKRLVTIYEGISLDIYNDSDVPAHRSAVRRELHIPDSRKVVGNISRFVEGKGQAEILQAASMIIRSYQEVVFLMVGDGESMDALKEQANRLNLGDHVIFTGWRDDIQSILAATDIFVHCPTTFLEGLGIANLEAMAMGKPSVVSDNGGLPDAVLDGVTGYVVPVGDVQELTGAILKLLRDERLSEKLGGNARDRIRKEFDIKQNARKLEDVFSAYA